MGTESTSLNKKNNKIILNIIEKGWPSPRIFGMSFFNGTYIAGKGNDLIRVNAKARANHFPSDSANIEGVSVSGWLDQDRKAVLDLANGNDKIIVSDKFGILDAGLTSNGIINMGDGWDTIKVKKADIIIGGQINFGAGRDTLTAKARKGSKSDNLDISGVLSTGDGDDLVEATKIYVREGGMISMGNGNDVIRVHRKSRFKDYAIYSNGTIDMGDGDDRIEGLLFVHGNGRGDTYPGRSKVETKFGPGEDTLVVVPGTYVIEEKSIKGVYQFGTPREGEIVDISGLEYLESGKTGNRHPFTEGTIDVL